MFKLLRKYNKLMLSVFGVLLMITFLIPQAFNRMGEHGASTAKLASFGDGRSYTAADERLAQTELKLVGELFNAGVFRGGFLRDIKKPEHWFLLAREAQDAGLVSATGAASADDQQIAQIAAALQTDPQTLRQVVAKHDGILELLNLYSTNGLYSDRRLMNEAQHLLHQANIEFVIVQPDKTRSPLQPTEEQIQTQLDKFGSKAPGEGDSGFGYKLPDRVKLEWLTIAADSVREIVKASEKFSNLNQRIHWRSNVAKTEKNFPPVDAAAPVPDVVRNDLLKQLTDQKLSDIAKFASSQFQQNRRGLEEKEGFVVLPSDWNQRKLDFQSLAAAIQKEFNVALPAYEASGEKWLTVDDAAKLPGIGMAGTDAFGRTATNFSQLIRTTKELGAGSSLTPIQKDIAGPPLRGSDGSVFLFRVIDAQAAHAPTSPDEVRDQIIADLRRAEQFEDLASRLDELEKQAIGEGLTALALANHTTVQRTTVSLVDPFMLMYARQLNRPPGVTPSPLPVIGSNRTVNEEIIRRALALPRETPIDQIPDHERTFVVPVKDKLAIAVVRIVGQQPVTKEVFTQLVQQGAIQTLVAVEENKDAKAAITAFSFDELAKRHNFKSELPPKERDDDVIPVPVKTASTN